MALSKDDRALLRRVIRWSRANGWRHRVTWEQQQEMDGTPIEGWTIHTWSREGYTVTVTFDSCWFLHGVRIEPPNPDGWDDLDGFIPRRVADLIGTAGIVDVLAALGILPGELSSQWQAGHDAATEGIRQVASDYYGWAKAPADRAGAAIQKSRYLAGLRDAADTVCVEIGIAYPLWDEMEAVAADA